MRKRFSSYLLAVIILLTLPLLISAVPEPAREFYVSDYAGVINSEHEAYYINQGDALEKATGAQIVVATVKSLDGKEISSYAVDLFRSWGIGDQSKDNGLLILLAPNERQIYVSVGYGLEGAINDAKAGRAIDEYAIPYLSENDFDSGIYHLYNALLPEVYQEYNLPVPDEVPNAIAPQRQNTGRTSSMRGFVPFALVGVLLLISIIGRGGRGGRGGPFFRGPRGPFGPFGGFGGGFGGGSSGGFGGGGFGGSGGFGGGGFSGGGGGGSTGGGGAGRGF